MGISIELESQATVGPTTTYHVVLDGLDLFLLTDIGGAGGVQRAIRDAINAYIKNGPEKPGQGAYPC